MIDPSTSVYFVIISFRINATYRNGSTFWLKEYDFGGSTTIGNLMALHKAVKEGNQVIIDQWAADTLFTSPQSGKAYLSIIKNAFDDSKHASLPFINDLILNDTIMHLPEIRVARYKAELILNTPGGCIFSLDDTIFDGEGSKELDTWLEKSREKVKSFSWSNNKKDNV